MNKIKNIYRPTMIGQWLSAHRICLQRIGTLGYFNTCLLDTQLHNLAS